MLDTTTASLRAWEERYGVVIPVRSPGDQRLYSRDQVDQLRYVQHLLESGLHAGEAHRLLALRLDDGMTLVPPAPAVLARASILLAERDIYAAELVEYLLRTEGYEVIVALDAADTRRLFDEHQPTLVFLELLISGGVGIALCRKLCEAGGRVVAVSGLALAETAIDAGAEAFLRKPLEPFRVLSTVKDLVAAGHTARRSAPAPS
jgi:DNA-binding transcriptional MerR regulator